MGLLDDAIREHLELKRRRGADASEISRAETDALGPVRRSPEGVPQIPDAAAAELRAPDDEPAGGHEVPAAPWQQDPATVHAPPPGPGYEPPPVPSAAAGPAETYDPPETYEPPPVPAPPAYQRSPAPAPAPAEAEPDFDPFPELDSEPPAPEPEVEERGSLLSRFKRSRREAAEGRGDPPPAEHDPSSSEPPPAAYEPPPPPAPAPAPYATRAHEPDIVPADEEPAGEDLLEETPDFLEETPEHDRLWFEQRPPRDFDFDG